MKKNIFIAFIFATALFLCGCSSMGPNEEQDTAVGAVGGAAVGAAVASNPLVGAAVGAGVGGVGGAAIGDAQDRKDYEARRDAAERDRQDWDDENDY